MDRVKTLDMIRAKEGYAKKLPNGDCVPYKCPAGHWTIGHGFNLDAAGYAPEVIATMHWSKSEAEKRLQDKFDQVVMGIRAYFPQFDNLDDVRQAVVVIMGYALGLSGLLKWRPTLAHIWAGEYDDAAQHLLDSLWQRQLKSWAKNHDAPTRLDEMAEMLRSGRWPG